VTGARADMLKCPKCDRRMVRRSHRQGLLERLYSVFLIYPYRCQLCAHRFLARQVMTAGNRHREFERVNVRFPVSFCSSYLGQKVQGEGTLQNLSVRGCALSTVNPAPKGSFLRILVSFSEAEAPIEIEVAVVRAVETSRMGLEFLSMRPEEEERLRRLMEALLYGRAR